MDGGRRRRGTATTPADLLWMAPLFLLGLGLIVALDAIGVPGIALWGGPAWLLPVALGYWISRRPL